MLRFTLNQKGVVHVLVLLLLLAGLVGGLVLVKNTQIFKPKAYNEQVSPLLRQQRTDHFREVFKIDSNVVDEQVELVVKDGLLSRGIVVDGQLVEGDAVVSILGDCIGKETNYKLSEEGIYPPLCLDEQQENKAVSVLISGAEFGADFFVSYTQAKESIKAALDLGSRIEVVRNFLNTSGVAKRSASEISGSNSTFDGYLVTLIRIKDLERDVINNPDSSGKLTSEEEQARREYALALRDLWEAQHNVLLELSSAVALTVVDKPLKVVGAVAQPVVGPIVAQVGKTFGPTYQPIANFVRYTWNKVVKKVPQSVLELQQEIYARAYKVTLKVTDIPRPKIGNAIDYVAAQRWIDAHPEGVARDTARAIVQETRHISQQEFEAALSKSTAKFKENLRVAEDYAVFVEPKKSNQWVADRYASRKNTPETGVIGYIKSS